MSDAHWRAVGAGVVAGAPVLVPVALVQVLLVALADDPSDAWAVPLLALLLFAFGRAGATAAARGDERPYLLASLAAVAVFAIWVPIRVAIWAGGGEGNPVGAVGAGLLMTVLAGLVGAYYVGRRRQPA